MTSNNGQETITKEPVPNVILLSKLVKVVLSASYFSKSYSSFIFFSFQLGWSRKFRLFCISLQNKMKILL